MEVVCLASGPSLCAEDVELVRAWRSPGRAVYVANTTFRMAPWADTLYAHDPSWWEHHHAEVGEVFTGERVSARTGCRKYGATILPWAFPCCHNSGGDAVLLALERGATKVVLLGYDCQLSGGRAHWHGDHPAGLSNAASLAESPRKWVRKFEAIARRAEGRAVNATRETALTCFPRVNLEQALG